MWIRAFTGGITARHHIAVLAALGGLVALAAFGARSPAMTAAAFVGTPALIYTIFALASRRQWPAQELLVWRRRRAAAAHDSARGLLDRGAPGNGDAKRVASARENAFELARQGRPFDEEGWRALATSLNDPLARDYEFTSIAMARTAQAAYRGSEPLDELVKQASALELTLTGRDRVNLWAWRLLPATLMLLVMLVIALAILIALQFTTTV